MDKNTFNDKDTSLVTKQDLVEGSPQAILQLGVLLAAYLLQEGEASFRLTEQGHVQLSHKHDVISLFRLKETKALEALALLDFTDEDMLEHIKRREEVI